MEQSSPELKMYQLDIEEITKLSEQATRPNVKRQLIEYSKNLSRLLEEEKKKFAKLAETTKTTATSTESEKKPDININFLSISKYSLDTSSDKFVKIYLTDGFEEITSKNITSSFKKTSFDVCILDWKQKNYRFSCFNLNKNINPTDSYVKTSKSGLIICLAKENKGDMWDSLEKKKSILGDKDKEDEEEKAKDKDKDPNASLMEMMRDMYQNGDPEMKKMIAEAWTKSQSEQQEKKK